MTGQKKTVIQLVSVVVFMGAMAWAAIPVFWGCTVGQPLHHLAAHLAVPIAGGAGVVVVLLALYRTERAR